MYVDADYANKDNDGRSVSGVAVMVGGTVTKAVLNFLQLELASETIDLFEDNQGAIAIDCRKPNQREADEAH